VIKRASVAKRASVPHKKVIRRLPKNIDYKKDKKSKNKSSV
jgi:hypothetical protein